MKAPTRRQRLFLPFCLIALLLLFGAGRLGFILYNSSIESLSTGQFLLTWLRGIPLDLRTASLLLIVPALCSLQTRIPLRPLLVPYYVIVGLCVSVTTVADTVMYEFWKFKLSSVIISYALSPEGATNSVPPSFIIIRFAALAVYWLVVTLCLTALTPRRSAGFRRLWLHCIVIVVLALLPFKVGTAFSSRQSLFRNHASVNPLFAFAVSFGEQGRYQYLPPAECDSLVSNLYPATDGEEELTDTLLSVSRPNILVIQMESFGARFVSELGGEADVASGLSRLIPEGVFFTDYYSNSFRTDRGTVSLQSGIISHPTLSLMREARYHSSLPSLPRRLSENGYTTVYFYAGEMTNMGKHEYLTDMGYDSLYDIARFSHMQRECAWGMHDGTACSRLLRLLREKDTQSPWFVTFQTISSHEPWEVPYDRLPDPVLNAFAYTDECVAQLVDGLRASPLWDNLLIIILPDHGYLYRQTYEDPEFFHAPLLWTGGAIREPRRLSVLMNQSDIAATLLAQMGIPHADFRWSRNVLSTAYTSPFVYCNFPEGIMLRDSTGVSLFDIAAERPVTAIPQEGDPQRTLKAKCILQTFHTLLFP
ncbi:MAG: LTA synthase family protein [Prevotellaceae bacterium]|nr:LTA synthase family protein [Prevotellaceae bacterium]